MPAPGHMPQGHMPWCIWPRAYAAPVHMVQGIRPGAICLGAYAPRGICPGAYALGHLPRNICLEAYALGHMQWGICPGAYAPGHMPWGICPGEYALGHLPRGMCPRAYALGICLGHLPEAENISGTNMCSYVYYLVNVYELLSYVVTCTDMWSHVYESDLIPLNNRTIPRNKQICFPQMCSNVQ